MPPQDSLRVEAEARARERILRAFVECLDEFEDDDFPLSLVAKRAHLSERTLYRYFGSRADLLSAAQGWMHKEFFHISGHLASIDDLPAVYREACYRFEANPVLAKAIVRYPRIGDRAAFRAQVLDAHRRALRASVPDLPEAKARLLLGILASLDNVWTWVTMREELGLTTEEVADSVEWAMTTLIREAREADGGTLAAVRSDGGARSV
jgi:AcrR family transcriptional regulator